MWRDIRYAVRQFRRQPGVFAIALGGLAIAEGASALNRFENRKRLFAIAARRAQQTGRRLVVVGDPDAGLHTRLLRAYGCGDVCVDLVGCSGCPDSISADITAGPVRGIEPNSAVVYVVQLPRSDFVLLDSVLVTGVVAESASYWHPEFESRRREGRGQFVTRRQIEQRRLEMTKSGLKSQLAPQEADVDQKRSALQLRRQSAHDEAAAHEGHDGGDALELLSEERQPFDIVFTDVDKEDYPRVLRLALPRLRPGGLLICTVPAHRWMWTRRDEFHGHLRRYSRRSFRRVFAGQPLGPVVFSYYNSGLFPVMAAARLGKRLLGIDRAGADIRPLPPPLNSLLRSIFEAEKHILPHAPIPAGASLIAAHRKLPIFG